MVSVIHELTVAQVLLRGCRCLEIDVWDGIPMPTSRAENPSTDEAGIIASIDQTPELHQVRSQEKDKDIGDNRSRIKSLSKNFSQLMRHPSTHKPSGSKRADSAPAAVAGTEVIAPRPEPRVLHGYTLTKDIAFRDVCHAIRDSAFVASDLPVIVSLEVHANLEQQQIMVEIMQEVWKGLLVNISPDLDSANRALPRLEDVRRKILIKVKWAPAADSAGENPHDVLERGKSLENPAGETLSKTVSQTKKEKASKILQALGELAIYTRACHFSHFTQPGMIPSMHPSIDTAAYV
jgi:hypothetical protein